MCKSCARVQLTHTNFPLQTQTRANHMQVCKPHTHKRLCKHRHTQITHTHRNVLAQTSPSRQLPQAHANHTHAHAKQGTHTDATLRHARGPHQHTIPWKHTQRGFANVAARAERRSWDARASAGCIHETRWPPPQPQPRRNNPLLSPAGYGSSAMLRSQSCWYCLQAANVSLADFSEELACNGMGVRAKGSGRSRVPVPLNRLQPKGSRGGKYNS